MQLNKWNPKTHEYEPFESPARNTKLISRDMKELIDCAECGTTIEFGSSYTSKHIHTSAGFGYPVCEKCYHKEILLNQKY